MPAGVSRRRDVRSQDEIAALHSQLEPLIATLKACSLAVSTHGLQYETKGLSELPFSNRGHCIVRCPSLVGIFGEIKKVMSRSVRMSAFSS